MKILLTLILLRLFMLPAPLLRLQPASQSSRAAVIWSSGYQLKITVAGIHALLQPDHASGSPAHRRAAAAQCQSSCQQDTFALTASVCSLHSYLQAGPGMPGNSRSAAAGAQCPLGLPQQDNHCDCGLFLLTYVHYFCHSPPDRINKRCLEQSLKGASLWVEASNTALYSERVVIYASTNACSRTVLRRCACLPCLSSLERSGEA